MPNLTILEYWKKPTKAEPWIQHNKQFLVAYYVLGVRKRREKSKGLSAQDRFTSNGPERDHPGLQTRLVTPVRAVRSFFRVMGIDRAVKRKANVGLLKGRLLGKGAGLLTRENREWRSPAKAEER